MYDSASDIDDDTNIQELVLRGDFSELDRALEAGMSLEILDGVEWHEVVSVGETTSQYLIVEEKR